MQHREEDGSLHDELELPIPQQPEQHAPDPGLLRQALEDQGRADPERLRPFPRRAAVEAQHRAHLRKPAQRRDQGVELPAFAQPVQAPERGEHLLAHAPLDPAVVDELEVLVATGFLAPQEHQAPPRLGHYTDLGASTAGVKFPKRSNLNDAC